MAIESTDVSHCCEAVLAYLKDASQPKPKTIVDRAKDVAALAAAITSASFIFYVFGFVIVNLRLLSYGIRSYDIGDSAYIPAGVAFVVIVLGPLIAVVSGVRSTKARVAEAQASADAAARAAGGVAQPIDQRGYWFSKTLLFVGLYCVLLVALGSPFLSTDEGVGIVSSLTNRGFFKTAVSMFGPTTFWAIALCVVASLLVTGPTDKSERSLLLPSGSILIALMLFLTVSSWSRHVYARGNPALGGGALSSVTLQLKPMDDEVSAAAQLGLPGDADIAGPVKLIRETDKVVTVLLEDGHVLKLDRSLVLAIRYVP